MSWVRVAIAVFSPYGSLNPSKNWVELLGSLGVQTAGDGRVSSKRFPADAGDARLAVRSPAVASNKEE